jgi:hypothetical protein
MADAADDGFEPLLALQEFQPQLVQGLALDLTTLAAWLPEFARVTAAAGDILQ